MKPIVTAEWIGIVGDHTLDCSVVGTQRLEVDIVTEGCSLIYFDGDNEEGLLLSSSFGAVSVVVVVSGDFKLLVRGDRENARTAVRLPAWLSHEAGWSDGPSLTQLDLKKPDDIPPAIRHMMDTMQSNALRREAALRAEIERLRG